MDDDEKVSPKKLEILRNQCKEISPKNLQNILSVCSKSFSLALIHIMEGRIENNTNRLTLEQELFDFSEWLGNYEIGRSELSSFDPKLVLPSKFFSNLGDYVDYLRHDVKVPACDIGLNGGAQFERLKFECEVALRFTDFQIELTKKDITQARGIGIALTSWEEVVRKLLAKNAHVEMKRKIKYVSLRLCYFFMKQKDSVLDFMESINQSNPDKHLFSAVFYDRYTFINFFPPIKRTIFDFYDEIILKKSKQFESVFESYLKSIFANPLLVAKGQSWHISKNDLDDVCLPSFDDTKERLPLELGERKGQEDKIKIIINSIPSELYSIDEAFLKIKALLTLIFKILKGSLCDQMELFADSFFKLPMLRHLEQDMSEIEISSENRAKMEEIHKNLLREIEMEETRMRRRVS